jgi:voltage-gated potassium channel
VATCEQDHVARQLSRSLLALAAVILVGTVGYFLLGFSPWDAIYQTVATVTTIGFREVQPFGDAEKVITILFVLVGVGVVLYTLSSLLGQLIEGWAGNEWGRRRMENQIDDTEQKLLRAGADRVVNPQRIGGNRIAAFALQPHVTDFLDVAMHDEEVEFRLE